MKDLREVVDWGRVKLAEAAIIMGLPAEDLVLTGGASSRFYRDLLPADLDFVSNVPYKMPRPTNEAQIETPRAFTFIGQNDFPMQLLKRWSGCPPFQFDWHHTEAFVSLDDHYFPDCFVTGKLEVGGRPLDYPAPLVRAIKWLQLGFTIDKDQLYKLLSCMFPESELRKQAIWGGSA